MYTFNSCTLSAPTDAAKIYADEPEKILTLPENEQLMPENEPEKNLKIQLPLSHPHVVPPSGGPQLQGCGFFSHFNIFNPCHPKTSRHFNNFKTDPQNLRPF